MGRTFDEIMDSLPPERRARIEARAEELMAEIESLRALRQFAEQSQQQIAQKLGIKQPSVHKIEQQTDLYLSTLRRFVEAAGGTLELRVNLPGHAPIRLTGLADLHR
jgi:predicted XRE-type DNA-binding protein